MQQNTLPTQSSEKKLSIGARSPLPTPSFLSLCRLVVRLVQACSPHQGARHQTGRTQVGDTLQRVPTSGGRDGSSTSSAASLFCFTAGTFIPHASPSLQTGGGACEHSTAPFARPGVCTRVSYRGQPGPRDGKERTGAGTETVTGSGTGTVMGTKRERERGWRRTKERRTGTEAETGRGRERGWRPVDEHRMGTGTGHERGRGWRPVDKHRMGTGAGTGTRVETPRRTQDGNGNGDANENSSGDGDEDRNRDGDGGRDPWTNTGWERGREWGRKREQ